MIVSATRGPGSLGRPVAVAHLPTCTALSWTVATRRQVVPAVLVTRCATGPGLDPDGPTSRLDCRTSRVKAEPSTAVTIPWIPRPGPKRPGPRHSNQYCGPGPAAGGASTRETAGSGTQRPSIASLIVTDAAVMT